MSDNGQEVDVSSLQSLARGDDVVERVVIIGGAQGNVGQGGEVRVVPATVEGDVCVAIRRIQLVSTAGEELATCVCVDGLCRWMVWNHRHIYLEVQGLHLSSASPPVLLRI